MCAGNGRALITTSASRGQFFQPTLTGGYGTKLACVTTARAHLIDESTAGSYHLMSRCIRGSFLCGNEWEHRRQWICDALREQSKIFALDVLEYAVMENHFHLIVTTHPERARAWTPAMVAERWAQLFPRRDHKGVPIAADPELLERWANDSEWVHVHRVCLASVSWFMKVMKERIARRANLEEGNKGSFWQGRFKSVALLDQTAVTACMVYVSLNPIRANKANTPETSAFTSVQQRIVARQRYRASNKGEEKAAETSSFTAERPNFNLGAEDGLWIAPLARCTPCSDTVPEHLQNPLSLDAYLQLVDETGRVVRAGKRGSVSTDLLPILERLDIDERAWTTAMSGGGQFLGTAIGSAFARAKEAVRRGTKWIVDRMGMYRPPQHA
jgi:putative transposase